MLTRTTVGITLGLWMVVLVGAAALLDTSRTNAWVTCYPYNTITGNSSWSSIDDGDSMWGHACMDFGFATWSGDSYTEVSYDLNVYVSVDDYKWDKCVGGSWVYWGHTSSVRDYTYWSGWTYNVSAFSDCTAGHYYDLDLLHARKKYSGSSQVGRVGNYTTGP